MEEEGPPVVTYIVEIDENFLDETDNLGLYDETTEEAELGRLVDSMCGVAEEKTETVESKNESAVEDATGLESASDGSELETEDEEEELEAVQRQSELTQKYLAGGLTFSDFVQRMDDSDGENEEGVNKDDTVCPVRDEEKRSREAAAFVKEFEATERNQRRKGRKDKMYTVDGLIVRKPVRRRPLPAPLLSLIGEANIRIAKGEHDIAIEMLMQVVKEAPFSSLPYQKLATLFSQMGDMEKSLQFALMAAHLSPQDAKEWVRLAELSVEQRQMSQAETCLAKALRVERYNPDIYIQYIKLLQSMGKSRSARQTRVRMVNTMCSNHAMAEKFGMIILHQAKHAAREYHQDNDLPRAREILERAVKECNTSAVQDDVHLLLELLCSLQENKKGLSILQGACGVVLEPSEPPFHSCKCPDEIAPDLRAKLVIFLVRLKINAETLAELLAPLLLYPIEDAGDLYLDIAESLMLDQRYEEALSCLEPLVRSESYSEAAVWLQHGECLIKLERPMLAIASYEKVVSLAPQHVQARITLSSLLHSLNRHQEALNVLHCEDPEPRLLYEEFQQLYEDVNQKRAAIDVAQALISQYAVPHDAASIYANFINRKRIELPIQPGSETGPTTSELWKVIFKAANLCMELNLPIKMKRLGLTALGTCVVFDHKKEVEFLCLISAIQTLDPSLGYNIAKDFMLEQVNSASAWNLYTLAVQLPNEAKHARFIKRMLCMNQGNRHLTLTLAHSCFIAGSYKRALSYYGDLHRTNPDALTALMISIIFLHLACQKHTVIKHHLVGKMTAYFEEYKKLRGAAGAQEAHYNLGRAMHQLSLMSEAVHHYKQALALKPDPSVLDSEHLDLSREAAFNLAQIYTHSGSNHMARMIIEKYIVI